MKKSYLLANLFWLALALAVALEARSLKVGTFHFPGPGFLPFWAGVILGGLAVVNFVQTLRQKDDAPASELWGGISLLRLGGMLAALFAYAALLNTLGFLLATFLLLVYLYRAVEPYKWPRVVIYALLTIAAAYVFFVVLLDSRLPAGPWGF